MPKIRKQEQVIRDAFIKAYRVKPEEKPKWFEQFKEHYISISANRLYHEIKNFDKKGR